MILSVRRILEATYVMKVKLFIRSHGLNNWVMRVKLLFMMQSINFVEFVFFIYEELS